jgi:hypothetical protein
MEQMIFRYMDTIRDHTISTINELPEKTADVIPPGFNNNIRWNVGHIVFIQDHVTFKLLGEEIGVPKLYKLLFAPGTKPANWQFPAPTMAELTTELSNQKKRIREALSGKLNKELDPPFTNGIGLTFYTMGEALLFTFYHEALHMEVIKRINLAIQQGNA